MTLAELYNYAIDRFALSLTEVQIKEHLNEVYKDLTRIFTPDFITTDNTLSVAAGARTVNLTFPCRKVQYVKSRSGTTYTLLREVKKEALLLPHVTAGTPIRWGIDGVLTSGYLRLFVDPAAAAETGLSIDYEPAPATLADGDAPLYIPAEYHHLIALGGLALCLAAQEDWQNAQYWDGRFRDEVNTMIINLGLVASDNFPNIGLKIMAGGEK